MTKSYSLLSFDGLIDNGKESYLSSACFNGLIEIDRESGSVRMINKFPKENAFMYLLHHKLCKHGNKIIFTPDHAKNIHVMDMDSNDMICVDFKGGYSGAARCIDSYVWDNRLWLFFSNKGMPVTSMDLSTYEIRHYPELTESLETIVKDEDQVIFWAELWKDRGQAYGVFYDSGYLVHIDLTCRKTEIIPAVPEGKRMTGAAVAGETAYLTERDSYEVTAYSLADGSTRTYAPEHSLNLAKGTGYVYSNIVAANGKILLVPNFDNRILCIKDDRIAFFCHMPKGYRDIEEDGRNSWRRFYSTQRCGNVLRLFPAKANMLLDIDLKEEKAEGRSYKMPSGWMDTGYYRDYVTPYVRESARDAQCMYENDVVNLNDYIRVLESDTVYPRPIPRTEQNGRAIWRLFQ
mgnify:FL=1